MPARLLPAGSDSMEQERKAAGWTKGDYRDRPLKDLLADVRGSDPVPAAGSVTAVTVALAAGLTAKVARRSTLVEAEELAVQADAVGDRMAALATADAAGYAEVLAARRSGTRLAEALAEATVIPSVIASAAAEIAGLAAQLVTRGNPNLRFDAIAAADLAANAAAVAASLATADASETPEAARAVAAASRAEAIAAGVRRS